MAPETPPPPVVTVIIGALATITPTHEKWLAQIPTTTDMSPLQKTVLHGTAKIFESSTQTVVQDPSLTNLPPIDVLRKVGPISFLVS